MRIGITCYPTYGGSGAVATELGLELARRGHEIHIISYASPFRLPGFAENVYFHNVDLSGTYPLLQYFPYSLALAVKQHEVAMREELDILHVHYAVPHATAAFLAREMSRGERDLKVVTTLHGTDITLVGQENSFFTVTKFSIEESDAVTAVSKYLQDETHRHFGCSTCDIKVIPNFINKNVYHPRERCEYRSALAPPDSKIIVHVSNFRRLKRVPEAIRMFAKIQERVPSVLVLVGDGPERERAEQEAEQLGLKSRVRFLGTLEAVADVMQAADLFLLPSTSESFGLSALEAMACGVPVLASNVGGLPDVVDTGKTGYLVDPDDLDGFADAGVAILENETKWKQFRENAVKRADDFSEEFVVPQYESVYAEVLG